MKYCLLFAYLLDICCGFSLSRSPLHSQRPGLRPLKGQLKATAISTNADLLPGIATIDAFNNDVREQLHGLRETPYFRLYSVDILGSCEYMPQELFECYSETCEIYPIDDDEVRQVRRIQFFLLQLGFSTSIELTVFVLTSSLILGSRYH